MTNNAQNLVTIIVPVYNVEKYLHRCIDSIINQTYKNLRIILVNDGSTDSSGVICDDYAKIDNRIQVIHKKNGGLSSARNAGLAKCNFIGYLMFVDSDDWISIDAIEILLRNMLNQESDMIVFNFYITCNNKKTFVNTTGHCVFKTYEIKHKLILDIWLNSVWDKFYRADIYREIRFPEGQSYEDAYVMMDVLKKCNKIGCINQALYYYNRENSGSITKSINPKLIYDVYLGWKKKLKYREYMADSDYLICKSKAEKYGKEACYLNLLFNFLPVSISKLMVEEYGINDNVLNKVCALYIYMKYYLRKAMSSNYYIWSLWKKLRISRG